MLPRESVLARLGASRETAERLDVYVALLLKWQGRINLISRRTIGDIWSRHILDSGQIWLVKPRLGYWCDMGSGAGLPGLVVAILGAEEVALREVLLVESNAKKCAFLREAIRATGVRARVMGERIEQAADAGMPCDVVTSRALASLQELFRLSSKLFMNGAHGLFLKGQEAAAELTESRKSWNVQATLLQSISDPTGRIVHVTALSRREPD